MLRVNIRMKTGELTAVDLFCGCGGLTEGFRQAGFNILLGIDTDKWALETYNRHHENKGIFADIVDIDAASIFRKTGSRNIDVLIGGPPCQAFSSIAVAKWKSIGLPGTLSHPLNKLYKEFLRLVSELNPKFFVIENVERMIHIKNGLVKQVIEFTLGQRYNISFYKKDCAEFGVPQHRKRVLVIGNRLGCGNPQITRNLSGDSSTKYVSVCDAISDLPSIKSNKGNEYMKYPRRKAISAYAKERRIGSMAVQLRIEFP